MTLSANNERRTGHVLRLFAYGVAFWGPMIGAALLIAHAKNVWYGAVVVAGNLVGLALLLVLDEFIFRPANSHEGPAA